MNRALVSAIFVAFSYPFAGFWPTLTIIITSCFILKRKEILVFAFYLSFFNLAGIENAPFWAGLCGSLLATVFYFAKKPKELKKTVNNKPILLTAIILITYIAIDFLAISKGSFFERTATKSAIQQCIFVLLLLLFSIRNETDYSYLRENINKYALKFLAVYTLIYIFSDFVIHDELRFGGALGAQSLAFLLTLLVGYFAYVEKNIKIALLFSLCTTPTLSRTYLSLQLLIIFIIYITREKRIFYRLVYSAIGTLAAVTTLSILPLVSKRLNYYDNEFFGTLFGRLTNYERAFEMIRTSPIFGNGIGSFVEVLDNWVPEFYEYYITSGDTTIIHNEYIRILTETGIIGLILFSALLALVQLKKKGTPLVFITIFMAGSAIENTLALYSGPIFAFVILLCSSREPVHSIVANNQRSSYSAQHSTTHSLEFNRTEGFTS